MTIYFDNAATSWPKPACMIDGMKAFNEYNGSNPGRSGHSMAIEAGRILFTLRERIAELFSVADPMNIILTSGITHSLNLVINGLLKPGDHVITSSVEHNSVMRPLRAFEERGVELSIVNCDNNSMLDPELIKREIKRNTVMLILTHASNVTGAILPVEEAGKIAREYGILFCVDSAQSAGTVRIDVDEMNIDILCFSGHKGLLGPMGTGGLFIRNGAGKSISPLMYGGTGSRSEYEIQPDFMPDKFESGTLNMIGLAGLEKSVEYIIATGVDAIREKESDIAEHLFMGLKSIKGVRVYGPDIAGKRTSVVSFSIEGISPSDSALFFDEKYGILSRPGLHCSPSSHKTLGTFPYGTNRFSPGYFNTHEEVETALRAVAEIAGGKY